MVTDPFSTKTYAIKGIVIFLGGIVCALIAFSIHWYLTYTPEGINDPLLLDYGLVAANEVNSSIPSGYLYLLGSPAVPAGIQLSEPLTSRYYALPLANTDTLRPLPTTPEATQLTDSNRQYGLAILDIESPTVADDKFHPGLIDYQTNELTVLNTLPLYSETQLVAAPPTTSNRQWVAYSGRTIPIDDTITNIDTWQIVIYNPNTNELRTIPGAVQPAWLNGEADLLYLTADGIYRYNMAADASEPVDTNWNNLDIATELAVADNNTAAILTIPALNSIAVYQFTDPVNAEAELAGMIATPDTLYSNPVFSPGSTHYAVSRTTVTDPVPRIEIRATFERPVLDTITPALEATEPIQLSDWREQIEPVEWR